MNNVNLWKTNSIEKQLNDVKIKNREYYRSKNNLQSNTAKAKENITTENGQWPKNTTLIVGDAIINGVLEGLCSGGRNGKVRNFPGATVDGLNHHIIPLLQKKSSHIIVHTGRNDAYDSTSREILNKLLNFLNKLLNLKLLIQEKLLDCKVLISTPTLRSDNRKATLTVN